MEEDRDAVLVTDGDSEIGQVCFTMNPPSSFLFEVSIG